jgi:hypothetical protein
MIRDKISTGYRALLARGWELGEITVGVHANEGAKAHGDSGLTVNELATIHEFGLGVPERSFIRSWADAKREKIRALIRHHVKKSLTLGEMRQALDRIALLLQADAQKWISDGNVKPPLAEKTIARKKSSVPLIDSGILRSSILSVVQRVK